MNNFIFVGTISKLPETREVKNQLKVTTLCIEVERAFKNNEGVYEKDVIVLTLWKGIADTILGISEIGAKIAVKGRVQSYLYEKEDRTYYNYDFVAEKVTFI